MEILGLDPNLFQNSCRPVSPGARGWFSSFQPSPNKTADHADTQQEAGQGLTTLWRENRKSPSAGLGQLPGSTPSTQREQELYFLFLLRIFFFKKQ
jgi:hypothetical protein